METVKSLAAFGTLLCISMEILLPGCCGLNWIKGRSLSYSKPKL